MQKQDDQDIKRAAIRRTVTSMVADKEVIDSAKQIQSRVLIHTD